MRYRVEVTERIACVYEVDAPSSKEAMMRMARRYFDEDIVVESGVAPEVAFRVLGVRGRGGRSTRP